MAMTAGARRGIMQTVGASMPQPLVQHHGMMTAAKGPPALGVCCAAWGAAGAAAAAAARDLAAPTRLVMRATGARRGRLVILRRMVLILRLQRLPYPKLRKEKNRYDISWTKSSCGGERWKGCAVCAALDGNFGCRLCGPHLHAEQSHSALAVTLHAHTPHSKPISLHNLLLAALHIHPAASLCLVCRPCWSSSSGGRPHHARHTHSKLLHTPHFTGQAGAAAQVAGAQGSP